MLSVVVSPYGSIRAHLKDGVSLEGRLLTATPFFGQV